MIKRRCTKAGADNRTRNFHDRKYVHDARYKINST